MTQELKEQLKKKKKWTHLPSKDYFGQELHIGDVVIIAQHSDFTPGVLIGISENGITISCYRSFKEVKVWNRATQSYVPKMRGSVCFNFDEVKLSWGDRRFLEHVPLILSTHNSTHYVRLYTPVEKDGFKVWSSVINLTKLNLIPHENLKD